MIRYGAPGAEDADAAISSYFYLPGKCRASPCCRLHPEKMERWRWRDILLLELHPETCHRRIFSLYWGREKKAVSSSYVTRPLTVYRKEPQDGQAQKNLGRTQGRPGSKNCFSICGGALSDGHFRISLNKADWLYQTEFHKLSCLFSAPFDIGPRGPVLPLLSSLFIERAIS